MPPKRVGTGREQTYDCRSCLGAVKGFHDPLAQHGAIGRVHPTDALPILPKTVLAGGVEVGAFGIIGKRSHIGREMKFAIERGEQLRGCLPFVGLMPEDYRPALAFALPIGCLSLRVVEIYFWSAQGPE